MLRSRFSGLRHIAFTAILSVLLGGRVFGAITTPLTPYSANRHYFVNNGTPVVILGAGCPLPGHKVVDYHTQIDDMAAHKVNYGRVWHILPWDAKNAYFPWARDGGGAAKDGLPKFNLTHWEDRKSVV